MLLSPSVIGVYWITRDLDKKSICSGCTDGQGMRGCVFDFCKLFSMGIPSVRGASCWYYELCVMGTMPHHSTVIIRDWSSNPPF